MAPNPSIIQAVEKLGYRVTVGDIATQAGLDIGQANLSLLALASDAGGHLQVADTGDIVFLFPKNFRDILRDKYFKLKVQEWIRRIWSIVFYLIRISFGIVLIASIALISISIVIILNVMSERGESGGWEGGGFFFFPDLFWYLSPDFDRRHRERRKTKKELNFFEAVFSFLFGDGNPNPKLEERRWQEIGTVISENRGAVIAEQISPYLDDIGEKYQQEYEDYMLPVLTRFNGQPEVSPQGQIIYYFPELQVSAVEEKPHHAIATYLDEYPWKFSVASSGQIILSAGLGIANFVGALVLGSLLRGGVVAANLGGLVAFVQGIYWLLLVYGTGFLVIPLVRYFWIKWRNQKIAQRNRERLARTVSLSLSSQDLQSKLAFAQQFAAEKYIGTENLTYSTEDNLLEQEFRKEIGMGDGE